MKRSKLLAWLLRLEDEERFAHLARLSEEEHKEFATHWRLWARQQQLPPDGDWRLWLIMAGRGFGKTRAGAEWVRAIAGHAAGERFILLDSRPVPLDPALVGSVAGTSIVAAGRGDPDPVISDIALQGITLRPLSPVHPSISTLLDGTLELAWTRRARGAWQWVDGVDAPLHEEAESYQVTFGDILAPAAIWSVTEPLLTLSVATMAELIAALPGGELHVRQQGSYALSEPLYLTSLS